jgi:hypothetical protein
VGIVSGLGVRVIAALRRWRFQFFIGPSINGFTLLLGLLTPVWLVLIVWLGTSTKQDWLFLVLDVLWVAAVVWSIVVASRDDAREGTGRWYGAKGVVATRSWEPLFKNCTRNGHDHDPET